MKIRTHITIEKETLDAATKDAKRLGLSMSAYVGLLIPGKRRNTGWFHAPTVIEALETVMADRENGIQKKIEKALGCQLPEQCSTREGVDCLIARYNELKKKDRLKWYGTQAEYDEMPYNHKIDFIDPREGP